MAKRRENKKKAKTKINTTELSSKSMKVSDRK